MLSISSEYELSLNDNSNQLIKAKIAFADKTVRELTGDDIVACSFDQQVSSEGSFDVGTAIIGQMNITLNNHDGRFDACDFTDSKFMVWVGKELSTGIEWIQRGLYTANQPDAYNGTIAISALDSLSKFEVPFSKFVEATGLLLNDSIQIRQVIDHMCGYCRVKWDDDGNKALGRPFVFAYVDQNATCRQVLAYCCQVCCVNASATYNGHLRTVWYDTSAFESEDDCNGGVFDSDSPYSTGASKDGGDFLDYSSGDSVEGGTFITNRNVHQLYSFSSVTVNTDDVLITGVRVSERNVTENNETISGETVQIGEDGYVLSIGNNPLILPGIGRDVAETIASKVIGMRFRPFSGKHICVPSIEAGDCAHVIDCKQNMYRSYVTRVKYTVNGGMTISCGAKSASRNSADNAGASTSAYVKARNEIQRELSARDLAIKSLGESLANAKGIYHTEVKQDDGSYVYYLHDKPMTGESKIIYKISADGIGISTDSGKTYATGLSADGDAILNRIYAIGIDADHITAGVIKGKVGNNFWNLNTGEMLVDKLGNSVGTYAEIGTMSDKNMEYYKGIFFYLNNKPSFFIGALESVENSLDIFKYNESGTGSHGKWNRVLSYGSTVNEFSARTGDGDYVGGITWSRFADETRFDLNITPPHKNPDNSFSPTGITYSNIGGEEMNIRIRDDAVINLDTSKQNLTLRLGTKGFGMLGGKFYSDISFE